MLVFKTVIDNVNTIELTPAAVVTSGQECLFHQFLQREHFAMDTVLIFIISVLILFKGKLGLDKNKSI